MGSETGGAAAAEVGGVRGVGPVEGVVFTPIPRCAGTSPIKREGTFGGRVNEKDAALLGDAERLVCLGGSYSVLVLSGAST